MKVSVIGLGLIGGSIAKDLKLSGFATEVLGIDQSEEHQKTALRLGIVDRIETLEKAVKQSDLVVLAIPVSSVICLLPSVLDLVKESTTVTDVGSTKESITSAVLHHPHRKNYVASHPMSGTENSGPEAALEGLFKNKVCIICDQELSAPQHVKRVEDMYKALGGKLAYMSADDHDHNTAYISHLPHVTAFALANSVLQKEDRQVIVELAGGGFRDAARLAKSSPEMWTPIFENNKKYLLNALSEYSKHLNQMTDDIANDRWDKVFQSIQYSNKLREFLSK